MQTIIAAAGLASASWLFYVAISWMFLVLVLALNAAAYMRKSPMIAAWAMVVLSLFCILMAPWHAFAPFIDAEAYDDPDVIDFLPGFYSVGIGWIVTCLVSVGVLIYVLTNKKPKPGEDLERN